MKHAYLCLPERSRKKRLIIENRTENDTYKAHEEFDWSHASLIQKKHAKMFRTRLNCEWSVITTSKSVCSVVHPWIESSITAEQEKWSGRIHTWTAPRQSDEIRNIGARICCDNQHGPPLHNYRIIPKFMNAICIHLIIADHYRVRYLNSGGLLQVQLQSNTLLLNRRTSIDFFPVS